MKGQGDECRSTGQYELKNVEHRGREKTSVGGAKYPHCARASSSQSGCPTAREEEDGQRRHGDQPCVMYTQKKITWDDAKTLATDQVMWQSLLPIVRRGIYPILVIKDKRLCTRVLQGCLNELTLTDIRISYNVIKHLATHLILFPQSRKLMLMSMDCFTPSALLPSSCQTSHTM